MARKSQHQHADRRGSGRRDLADGQRLSAICRRVDGHARCRWAEERRAEIPRRGWCIEALMQDGRALQAGTSHFPGSELLEGVRRAGAASEEGKKEYPWATSSSTPTRLIGGLIMTHSDDNGLVVPPRLAATHVVICPMGRNNEKNVPCVVAARTCCFVGRTTSRRFLRLPAVASQDRPRLRSARPPLRRMGIASRTRAQVESGQRHRKNGLRGCSTRCSRQRRQNIWRPSRRSGQTHRRLVREIQKNLFERAKKYRDANMRSADTYDEFKQKIKKPGFIWAHWDGTRATEDKIGERLRRRFAASSVR